MFPSATTLHKFLVLHNLLAIWSLQNQITSTKPWKMLADAALHILDLPTALRIYIQLWTTTFLHFHVKAFSINLAQSHNAFLIQFFFSFGYLVTKHRQQGFAAPSLSLEKLEGIEDRNLLSGHIAVIMSDFAAAQVYPGDEKKKVFREGLRTGQFILSYLTPCFCLKKGLFPFVLQPHRRSWTSTRSITMGPSIKPCQFVCTKRSDDHIITICTTIGIPRLSLTLFLFSRNQTFQTFETCVRLRRFKLLNMMKKKMNFVIGLYSDAKGMYEKSLATEKDYQGSQESRMEHHRAIHNGLTRMTLRTGDLARGMNILFYLVVW